MAKAAGVEFIPASKLRQLYPEAASSRSNAANNSTAKSEDELADGAGTLQDTATELDAEREKEDDEEKENCLSNEMKENAKPILSSVGQRGTEVSLCGMQMTDGTATVVTRRITLMIACARCTNTTEVQLSPGQAYHVNCPRCHIDHLMEFSSTIAHQMSSVIGWLNLEGCRPFDLVLADCQFSVGCINCSKEEQIAVSILALCQMGVFF